MDEAQWATVVDSVLARECTPFLGAGVGIPHLPSGQEVARELAAEYGYPLTDVDNLARVAQYIATRYQAAFARRKLQEKVACISDRSSILLLLGM